MNGAAQWVVYASLGFRPYSSIQLIAVQYPYFFSLREGELVTGSSVSWKDLQPTLFWTCITRLELESITVFSDTLWPGSAMAPFIIYLHRSDPTYFAGGALNTLNMPKPSRMRSGWLGLQDRASLICSSSISSSSEGLTLQIHRTMAQSFWHSL